MAISTIANATQPVDTQESHPGIGRESRYAEAVIAFNKRKTEEAVKILNELLKESPLTVEYLELKALALKGKGDEKTSLEVYQQLYQAKPENERGFNSFHERQPQLFVDSVVRVSQSVSV
jgi:predicted Zn-dependent protease